MLETHGPTLIRLVTEPISCAVANASLLTSGFKIASKPASSASRATDSISRARHPMPGTIPNANRSVMSASPCLLCRLLPSFGRGWDQGAPTFDFDDRAFRRAIHQARGTSRVSAFIPVDLDAVQWLQRDINGVDVDLAADDVAHPALGAAFVVDFETGHAGLVNLSLGGAAPAAPEPRGRAQRR